MCVTQSQKLQIGIKSCRRSRFIRYFNNKKTVRNYVPSCFSPTALLIAPLHRYLHLPCTCCIASCPVPAPSTHVLCHLVHSDARCPYTVKFVFDHISIFYPTGSKERLFLYSIIQSFSVSVQPSHSICYLHSSCTLPLSHLSLGSVSVSLLLYMLLCRPILWS